MMVIKISLFFLAWFPCIASAQEVLDQDGIIEDSTAGFAIQSNQTLAQTFTVGVTGMLTSVQLQLGRREATDGSYIVDIYPATDGVPSLDPNAVLYSDMLSVDTLPTLEATEPLPWPVTRFELKPVGINVQKGDELAIVVSRKSISGPPWVVWTTGHSELAGKSWVRSRNALDPADRNWKQLSSALSFATFVTPGP